MPSERRRWARPWALALAGCARAMSPSVDPPEGVVAALDGDGLSRARLLDPETCQGCHSEHYDSWAMSVHAHAADDPVFLAINRRGQRETGGKLGDFCVRCHAPMAVREGLTQDGLNLPELPQAVKGVTCYFCHNVQEVAGTHNNPLVLANDTTMRGSWSDPVPNSAHASMASPLMQRSSPDSAALCGSCHDIHSRLDVHIERTYLEWQQSAYSGPSGSTCNNCHMNNLGAPRSAADLPALPPRQLHSHLFPGVDTIDDPTLEGPLGQANQKFLDDSLSAAVCVVPLTKTTYQLRVLVDNVASGHGFTSGAALDRRLWAEVVAEQGGEVIYSSGVAPAAAAGGGEDVGAMLAKPDPDLWLVRECIFDAEGKPLKMFWDAAATSTNTLAAPASFDINDKRSALGHRERPYPRQGGQVLAGSPDRVRLRLRLQPIGQDILDDLVESGDLAAGHHAKLPIYTLASTQLTWTPEAMAKGGADYIDANGQPVYCVKTANFNPAAPRTRDTSLPGCTAPTALPAATSAR